MLATGPFVESEVFCLVDDFFAGCFFADFFFVELAFFGELFAVAGAAEGFEALFGVAA